jgi:hypothetical protein
VRHLQKRRRRSDGLSGSTEGWPRKERRTRARGCLYGRYEHTREPTGGASPIGEWAFGHRRIARSTARSGHHLLQHTTKVAGTHSSQQREPVDGVRGYLTYGRYVDTREPTGGRREGHTKLSARTSARARVASEERPMPTERKKGRRAWRGRAWGGVPAAKACVPHTVDTAEKTTAKYPRLICVTNRRRTFVPASLSKWGNVYTREPTGGI